MSHLPAFSLTYFDDLYIIYTPIKRIAFLITSLIKGTVTDQSCSKANKKEWI